ncbi:hypothetical protein M9H77_07632 [Catharanthus roseus]|uniref:Uncharacterized protein n=1 Tax=Catharanthus roseus TaxID=4058 RepID=A0ACC0BVQ4_CATRO|nr:hypothetical protein M9H77_07632 [Catharanthus roseus]
MRAMVMVLIIIAEGLTVDTSMVMATFLQEGKMALGYQSEQDMHSMKEHKAYVKKQSKMCLPPFGQCELEPYLEWEGKVEKLFQVYDLMEKDKAPLALESFTHGAIGWWESACESRRKRVLETIKTWKILKEDMRLSFGVTYLEKQKRHNERMKPKKEKQLLISSQGLVKKETKKFSIVEESQRAIKLLQVKEVVGALVEVYAASEDSCDFKMKKSIEEEKESEIKEKERMERKESLVEES